MWDYLAHAGLTRHIPSLVACVVSARSGLAVARDSKDDVLQRRS